MSEDTAAVLEMISSFIASGKDNLLNNSQWFYPEGIDVYLRIGKRLINLEYKKVVTVSNITNADVLPNNQINGQGYFKSFMEFLESECNKHSDIDGILIENVMTERLTNILTKNNYVVVGEIFGGIATWYKPKGNTDGNNDFK